jgi:hypothetical protein
MLGAMAISSVRASRQAEGGGGAAGAACSVGFPVSAGVCFLAPDLSGSAAGASAGRALGNGTDAGSAVRPSFGPRSPENSRPVSGGQAPDFRAAAAGPACAQSISRIAATVTIGLSPQAKPAQGHLRLAFSALKFMAIP